MTDCTYVYKQGILFKVVLQSSQLRFLKAKPLDVHQERLVSMRLCRNSDALDHKIGLVLSSMYLDGCRLAESLRCH